MNFKYILLYIVSAAAAAGMAYLPLEYTLISLMALTVSVALLTCKKGYQSGAFALVIAVSINYAVGQSFLGSALCFACAISGLLMAVALLKGYPIQKLMTYGAGSFLMSILLAVLIINLVDTNDVIKQFLDTFFAGMKAMYVEIFDNPEMVAVIVPQNIPVEEFKGAIFVLIEELNKRVRLVLPSILLISTGLLTYFNLGIIRFILAKTGIRFVHIPTFPYLRMNRTSGWVMTIAWLLPSFINHDVFNAALLNVAIIIMWLFGICAISFIDYKLREKVKSAWLRALIYIGGSGFALMIFNIATTMLLMLGIADSILDLRTPRVRIKRG